MNERVPDASVLCYPMKDSLTRRVCYICLVSPSAASRCLRSMTALPLDIYV